MKKSILIILIISILTCCTCLFIPKQEAKVNAATENKFIIQAYGDSISYGYKLDDKNDAYPNVFAQYYVDNFNAEFYANGVSGDTTSDLLELLQPYKDGTASDMDTFTDTDVVLLCIGANNVLGPALKSISSYITGNMTEQELRTLFQENVDIFKSEYPEILDAFENKKVIAMTIYNPYKYSSLQDVQIDSSVNSTTASIIKNLINNYDAKFQEMLNISMEYLTIINNEIKTYANDDIYIVDICDLFSTFNKTQYQNYINSNPSNLTITNSDVNNLLYQSNSDDIMERIYNCCDPHPTKAGHQVIAEKHLENFKVFELSQTQDKSKVTTTLSVNTFINQNYKYCFYKIENNKRVLLKETTSNSITVQNSEIVNASNIFVEVYSGDNLIETSDPMPLNSITVKDDKTQNTTSNQENKNAIPLIITIALTVIVMIILIPIFIIFYKKGPWN